MINGFRQSGHALDQMQNRGLMPSIIENTIKNGNITVGKKAGTTVHYDSINNISVITNSQSRKVVTTGYGQIRQ
jgi:peptidase E